MRMLLFAGAMALGAAAAAAQTAAPHHDHGRGAASAEPASTAAYRAANARMHRDMDIRFTGDADIDFMRAMIAHHQGAIDMAGVVLAHGRDPAVRRLAETVVAAQTAEIAEMRAWLKARGAE